MNKKLNVQNFDDIDKSINELEPSFKKSSFITLQFVEHIFNSVSDFDKRVNKHTKDTLSNYIKRLCIILNQIDKDDQYSRYLPRDNFQVILDFCINHIYKILKNPKTSIIKEPKMIPLSKLTSITQRTVKWLGKKPGETVRVKLSNSRKILADKKRFSYDIKENQVTLYLLRKLNKIVRNRIDYGIKNNLYNIDYSLDIKNTLEKLVKLNNLSKTLPISESKIKKSSIPNNSLLSDKHYSIIWKTIKYLDKYYSEYNFNKRLHYSRNKFVSLFTISLLSHFFNLSSRAFIFDDLYFIDDKIKNIYIKCCNEYKNTNNYIILSILLESVHFEDKGNRRLLKIDIKNNFNENLDISFIKMKLNHNMFFETENKYDFNIKFSFKEKNNYEKNRGLPFLIYNDFDKSNAEFFADCIGLKDSINFVFNSITKNINDLNQFFKSDYKNTKEDICIDRFVFDFESYMPYFYINENTKLFNDNLISNINLYNTNYLYNINSLYCCKDAAPLKNIYKDENDINKTLFSDAVKNIRKELQDNFDLIYLTSDNTIEIKQKYVRSVLKREFNNIFPIWRSVAAASYIENSYKESLKNGDNILVIDLLDELAEPIKLEYTINNEKHIKQWKHYPPYTGLEGNKISFDNICKEYLIEFNKKYKIAENADDLNFLLDSGIVAKILTSDDIKNIYFEYKDKIYCIFKFNLKIKDILSLSDNYISRYKFNDSYKYIVVICNDLYDQEILNKKFNKSNLKYVSEKELSIGAYRIYDIYKNYGYSWIEYLPALSLEVIKDGRYHQLELIDENQYVNVGADFTLYVKEHLTLPSNVREIKLKLIKENDIGNRVFAFIRDKSFPLDRELEVKLKINYKYAAENSYELIAYPVDKNAGFEKILIEWDYNTKFEDKPIPFNANIQRELKYKFVQDNIEKFKNIINTSNINILFNILLGIYRTLTHFVYADKNDRDKIENIDFLYDFVKTNILNDDFIKKILNKVTMNINKKDCKKLLEFIFYKYASVLAWKFRENNEDDIIKGIYDYCLSILKDVQSINMDTRSKFIEFFARDNKSNKSFYHNVYNIFGVCDILESLLYEERDKDNIDILKKIYDETKDKDRTTLLGNLGDLIYIDFNLLEFISKSNSVFINEIKNITISRLKNISKEDKNTKSSTKMWQVIDYSLWLLSMLRLRPKYFKDLSTGSAKAIQLSEYIRKIDYNVCSGVYWWSEKGDNKNRKGSTLEKFDEISKVKFSMSKEPKVKMCRLLYVIDILLTGDDGENSISIESFDN